MSEEFWTDMQQTASELIYEFRTGVARLVRTTRTAVSPTRPYDREDDAPEYTTLSAVVVPVDKKMVDDRVVFERHAMVVCAHPGFEILGSDRVEVDGRERTILKVRRVPDAGTVVAWKLALAD